MIKFAALSMHCSINEQSAQILASIGSAGFYTVVINRFSTQTVEKHICATTGSGGFAQDQIYPQVLLLQPDIRLLSARKEQYFQECPAVF